MWKVISAIRALLAVVRMMTRPRRLSAETVGRTEGKWKLYETALQACSEEYDRIAARWHALDTKAQIVGGLAGGFIAAIAVIIQIRGLGTVSASMLFLGGALLLPLISSVFIMIVLIIRRVPSPMSALRYVEVVESLLDEEDMAEVRRGLYEESIDAWKEPLTKTSEVVNRKATLLMWSQGTLLLAIVSLTIYIVAEFLSIHCEGSR